MTLHVGSADSYHEFDMFEKRTFNRWRNYKPMEKCHGFLKYSWEG